MIYQVAIKSLPQEWLWCETWCDDESKQRAKTIDLVSVCIFPLYKQIRKCSNRNIFCFTNGMAPCGSVCNLLFTYHGRYRAVSGAPKTTPGLMIQ